MVRLVLFIVVALLLYLTFAYFTSDEIKRKKRKRSAILGLIGVVAVSILVFLAEVRQQYNIEESFVENQFEAKADGRFTATFDDVQLALEYQSGYANNRNAPRIHIVAKFSYQPQGLETLFCDDKEYQRFRDDSYGHWYPTPEIKLKNQHFVGKCFSSEITDKIRALPERTNQFKPINARYLFLPKKNKDDLHVVEFYTENLDIKVLRSQIVELLNYYQLYL